MNSGVIVGIIITLGLLAAVLWKMGVFSKKPVYSPETSGLPVRWPATLPYTKYTPQGVGCHFEDPISEEDWERIAPVIDMGIRNLLRGFLPSWSMKRHHEDYIIGFIKPTATNMDGSPALIVGGVQTAGTVLGVGTVNFRPPTIVLPQQQNWEYLSYLMHSVWFEGEHDAEWANDQAWFWQYVGAGDQHPHRPIENAEMPLAPIGLVGREEKLFVCGTK